MGGVLWPQDLVQALESCNARQLHLNPVTTATAGKCLAGIAAAECQELSAAEAKQLATEAAGDLRNAIGMLQMLLCGSAPVQQASKGRKVRDLWPKACASPHFWCHLQN